MTVALIHSPLVGPATWGPVADALRRPAVDVVPPSLVGAVRGTAPHWQRFSDAAAQAIRRAAPGRRVALAGHSGAGPLLPHVGRALGGYVAGYLFVDAGLHRPAGRPADLPLVSRADGLVPSWANDESLRGAIPDAELRRRVLAEIEPLPPVFFEEAIPDLDGWPDAPCGYLVFSQAYEAAASEARARGWPCRTLRGHHFHMLVDPDAVAEALLDLAAQAGVGASPA